VAHTYSIEENSNDPLIHRATHEIRAQTASYALHTNTYIAPMLSSCRWSQRFEVTHF